MSLDTTTLLAILGMALGTYACRLTGLMVGARLALTGRAKAALDAIPRLCSPPSSPDALRHGWPETIAGALTIVAAMRLPLLGVILTGVVSVVVLRALAG